MPEGSDAAPSASLDIFATLHHPWETPWGGGGRAQPSRPPQEHTAPLLSKAVARWGGKCQHQISLMGNSTLLQPQTPPRFPPAQGGFGGLGWG